MRNKIMVVSAVIGLTLGFGSSFVFRPAVVLAAPPPSVISAAPTPAGAPTGKCGEPAIESRRPSCKQCFVDGNCYNNCSYPYSTCNGGPQGCAAFGDCMTGC